MKYLKVWVEKDKVGYVALGHHLPIRDGDTYFHDAPDNAEEIIDFTHPGLEHITVPDGGTPNVNPWDGVSNRVKIFDYVQGEYRDVPVQELPEDVWRQWLCWKLDGIQKSLKTLGIDAAPQLLRLLGVGKEPPPESSGSPHQGYFKFPEEEKP